MHPSDGPLTISGMIAANAVYEQRVRNFLTALIEDNQAHARFLNMLSMLEHKGSRKIMLSQMDGSLDEETLKHLAEEARHAYFFKRQAERIGKQSLPDYTDENTTARAPALMYFARLDAGISRMLSTPPLTPPQAGGKAAQPSGGEPKRYHPLCYPWVSLIVELRACWLYGLYQEVLKTGNHMLSLKSLLAEEDMHLADMYAMIGLDRERLVAFSAYESKLFGALWPQIEHSISWKTPLAAA